MTWGVVDVHKEGLGFGIGENDGNGRGLDTDTPLERKEGLKGTYTCMYVHETICTCTIYMYIIHIHASKIHA